ncbi:NAD(P)H azoreductase [BD1-7 clade bacterium]|uniref:NAD(P)H azoreductase n=1 Tax=BD1-7 clade bacterium TaxID=2029982 RepID=A0A5S9QJN9_9GAMM|nr:NAD(P)H azoreductase [BD1-7 clade bacterium]
MKTTHPVLIIGATAKTGRRVANLLSQSGQPVRAVSRSTTPAFDWENPATWAPVLDGVRQAYITFQPDLAIPVAEETIRGFAHTARQAGVEHLVLLSGRGEEGAQRAEQVLQESGLDWNVVRASWFNQNFDEGMLRDSILEGHLMLPIGDVPEPFIDVDDIADVAFATLTQQELRNRVFEVTGPALMTFADCVQSIAEATGRPIQYSQVPLADFLSGMRAAGQPEGVLWLLELLFTDVLDGRNSKVTDGVEQALGRPARSFDDYVAKVVAANGWADAIVA